MKIMLKKFNNLLSQLFLGTKSITFEEVKSDIIPNWSEILQSPEVIKIYFGTRNPESKKDQPTYIQQLQVQKGAHYYVVESTRQLNPELSPDHLHFYIWKDGRKLAQVEKSQAALSLQLFFDLTMESILENGKKLLLPTTDNSTNLLENELKSVEWLKVTMEVYKKALSEIQSNPHLLFEFSLQYSHNNKTAEPIILFKSYNLFWQMKFLTNALLRVQFFNDKDQKELDEGKATPSLAGDFYHQKNQIWDQFIKTVESLSKTLARK